MPFFLLLWLMSVPLAQAADTGVWRGERHGVKVDAGMLPIASPTFTAPAQVPERSRVISYRWHIRLRVPPPPEFSLMLCGKERCVWLHTLVGQGTGLVGARADPFILSIVIRRMENHRRSRYRSSSRSILPNALAATKKRRWLRAAAPAWLQRREKCWVLTSRKSMKFKH